MPGSHQSLDDYIFLGNILARVFELVLAPSLQRARSPTGWNDYRFYSVLLSAHADGERGHPDQLERQSGRCYRGEYKWFVLCFMRYFVLFRSRVIGACPASDYGLDSGDE